MTTDAGARASSRSSRPRASARAPASASRWSTASRRSSAAQLTIKSARGIRHHGGVVAAGQPRGRGRDRCRPAAKTATTPCRHGAAGGRRAAGAHEHRRVLSEARLQGRRSQLRGGRTSARQRRPAAEPARDRPSDARHERNGPRPGAAQPISRAPDPRRLRLRQQRRHHAGFVAVDEAVPQR